MVKSAHKLENLKEINMRLVFGQIRSRGNISRSDIAKTTGLGKATVSTIVAELIDAGLIRESGSETPPIGRPKVLLSVVPEAGYAIGVEVTDTECRAVLTNLSTEACAWVRHPFPDQDLSFATMIVRLQAIITEVTADISVSLILAAGICVPGIVNPSTGTVSLSVILPWRDVNLADALAPLFPFPVVVMSRGNAATWGERWYGAGQDVDDLIYVRVGSGVVSGLVFNGQPYFGHRFGAGELGHVTVKPDGDLCLCGNRGCLATVATVDALLHRVQTQFQELSIAGQSLQGTNDTGAGGLSTLAQVIAAAQAGQPIARDAIAEVGRWLAVALAGVVNLLNLDMIIVGGPMAMAGDLFLEPLRQELARRALSTHLHELKVVKSILMDNAPAIGAASWVLHELMSPAKISTPLALPVGKASLF